MTLILVYAIVRIAILGFALNDSVAEAGKLQVAVQAKDLSAIEASLGRLGSSDNVAAGASSDIVLAPLTWIPGIGDDLVALQKVSVAAQGLTESAVPALQQAGSLQGQMGSAGFQSSTVINFRDAFNKLCERMLAADESLASIDAGKLAFGLGDKLPAARGAVHQATSAMNELQPLVKSFASVVAGGGRQN